jgi:hypothetical protein
MVERFQFGPVFFFQCPAFTSPKCYISNNRLIESATDMHSIFLLLSTCWFIELNSFLAWLIRSMMSAVSLSSGVKKVPKIK